MVCIAKKGRNCWFTIEKEGSLKNGLHC